MTARCLAGWLQRLVAPVPLNRSAGLQVRLAKLRPLRPTAMEGLEICNLSASGTLALSPASKGQI